MQVKCEVFSRFGNSVDISSGEPLGGVEAPTVGADLCVRPSSPERSLFCGRTRRSAPTQATSARQFHSSNAVTLICRDARECRVGGRWDEYPFVGTHDLCVRCIKGYSVVVLTRTDAQIVRPYMSLPVSNFYFREEIPNMSKEIPNMSSRFE